MGFNRLIGRKMVVRYTLLKDLDVRLIERNGRTLLSVRGSIVESFKVFDSVAVTMEDRTISLTVYASLKFWCREGSPEFSVTEELHLPSGTYTIEYAGVGEHVPLGEARSPEHE